MVDVLASRHARRAPYRLPPTPVSSISRSVSEAPAGSRASLSIEEPSAPGRTRRSRTNPDLPDGANEVITLAKSQFRLTLLTTHAMWPNIIARVQARDQLIAARITLNMETRESHYFILRFMC